MNPRDLLIRPVRCGDNPGIGEMIRSVLGDFGVSPEGSTLADPSLDNMYAHYQAPRSGYWVIADQNGIWGGGGIAPLEGADPSVCELQKMYLKKDIRGLGLGTRLLKIALDHAERFGVGLCYLETLSEMEAARELYRRHGFRQLDAPRGCTGHPVCSVWMEKILGERWAGCF